ncbi:MAG: hypothetical protein JXB50_04290 [Spirochaetes bacterium]|nr:hypothetical protein [Spirochaetota bacterium]
MKNYKIKVERESLVSYSGYSTETVNDMLIIANLQIPESIRRLELYRKKPLRKPDSGVQDFFTGNFSFNLIFKTRRGDPAVVKLFTEIPELPDNFAVFYLKWFLRLSDFSVQIDHVKQCFICRLNYGSPWTEYISIKNLGKVLNDLIRLIGFF